MVKRLLSFCLVVLILPVLLGELGQSGNAQNDATAGYNALVNTVRIVHNSPYKSHFGVSSADVVAGSGVLLDNGMVLSCYNLLSGYEAGEIVIQRFNGATVEVRQGTQVILVAWDKKSDLLLLQVMPPFHGSGVKVAAQKPKFGERIMLTGHPQLSLTKLRLYQYLEGSLGIMITPVFFGDSGGGVFNSNGELIGNIKMILSIQSPLPQNTLYGYATPLDAIREFLNERPRRN